jgi:hypothetical protein
LAATLEYEGRSDAVVTAATRMAVASEAREQFSSIDCQDFGDHERSPVHALDTTALRVDRCTVHIPNEWFGRHLTLLAPCAHFKRHGALIGPATAALLGFVGERTRNVTTAPAIDHALAAELLCSVFCSVSVIIDATRWALVEIGCNSPSVLLERCLGTSTTTHDPGVMSRFFLDLDAWLARKLRLDRAADTTTVVATGSAAERPWPTVPRPAQPAVAPLRALWAPPKQRPRFCAAELRFHPQGRT